MMSTWVVDGGQRGFRGALARRNDRVSAATVRCEHVRR